MEINIGDYFTIRFRSKHKRTIKITDIKTDGGGSNWVKFKFIPSGHNVDYLPELFLRDRILNKLNKDVCEALYE